MTEVVYEPLRVYKSVDDMPCPRFCLHWMIKYMNVIKEGWKPGTPGPESRRAFWKPGCLPAESVFLPLEAWVPTSLWLSIKQWPHGGALWNLNSWTWWRKKPTQTWTWRWILERKMASWVSLARAAQCLRGEADRWFPSGGVLFQSFWPLRITAAEYLTSMRFNWAQALIPGLCFKELYVWRANIFRFILNLWLVPDARKNTVNFFISSWI